MFLMCFPKIKERARERKSVCVRERERERERERDLWLGRQHLWWIPDPERFIEKYY